jgi:Legume lectin domain
MKLDALFSLDSGAAFAPNRFHFDHRLQLCRTRLAAMFLLAMGAIWGVRAAEAQIVGPNFANACPPPLIEDHQPPFWVFGGSASSTTSLVVLTDGGVNEAGSVFCGVGRDPASFATAFTFQLINPFADGFTFTVTDPPEAIGEYYPPILGDDGGSLGYYGLINYDPAYQPDLPVPSSVAIKFDLFNNEGEGPNSTGIYIDGAFPGQPSINLTGTGIDLHSGHPIAALVTYVKPTLNLTLTDTATQATWSHAFTVDIPAIIPGNNVSLAFTGGTGALTATQEILKWNTAPIYYPAGFTSNAPLYRDEPANPPNLQPNLTSPDKLAITLTQGYPNSASSVFTNDRVGVQAFTTDFTFQISNAVGGQYVPPLGGGQADGFTFVIQFDSEGNNYNDGGSVGGALGYNSGSYLPEYPIYPDSVAIKFDLYNNEGEGPNSTGLYTDGAFPGQPSIDLTGSGIDLHSPDILDAHITYDGTTLILTLTDTVTGATFTHGFPIDIPATVSSPDGVAYVGFTAATGADTSTIQILSWTYWVNTPP